MKKGKGTSTRSKITLRKAPAAPASPVTAPEGAQTPEPPENPVFDGAAPKARVPYTGELNARLARRLNYTGEFYTGAREMFPVVGGASAQPGLVYLSPTGYAVLGLPDGKCAYAPQIMKGRAATIQTAKLPMVLSGPVPLLSPPRRPVEAEDSAGVELSWQPPAPVEEAVPPVQFETAQGEVVVVTAELAPRPGDKPQVMPITFPRDKVALLDRCVKHLETPSRTAFIKAAIFVLLDMAMIQSRRFTDEEKADIQELTAYCRPPEDASTARQTNA